MMPFLVTALAAPLPATAAGAADAPRWDPGERTTSHLPGDVKGEEDVHGDGVYTRFDGFFDLGLSAGAELSDGGGSAAVSASVHYLFMAGIYAEYADALGQSAIDSRRLVSFGVDLRPAFVPRWSKGLEKGPGILDLTVDSISIGMGAFFREPPGRSFGSRRGLELSLGLGVPLLGTAEGAWLGARGLLRWDDPLAASGERAEARALLTLGWHVTL